MPSRSALRVALALAILMNLAILIDIGITVSWARGLMQLTAIILDTTVWFWLGRCVPAHPK